ncbi:hypothetical protein F383_35652 [Gossypium arboreum]|uniref:Uncharacterized protein n=1 Tax=Gossypium arboreum TaxID=29729 RepID=A0A0B0N7J7_GOSAR|nr:hypothetical protein F383_35652 [Gossypium arboreum]
MGQRTKSTRPRLPHTGRPHGCVPLARRSKAYKYTLEEEKRGNEEEEARNCLRKAGQSISEAGFTIKAEDLPSNSLKSFGILIHVKLLFGGGIDPV